MKKNLSQVRQVWKRQTRDANGRFSSVKKFDYSADKALIDTLVRTDDKSVRHGEIYTLDELKKAFYEGANGSTLFTLSKRFDIFLNRLR